MNPSIDMCHPTTPVCSDEKEFSWSHVDDFPVKVEQGTEVNVANEANETNEVQEANEANEPTVSNEVQEANDKECAEIVSKFMESLTDGLLKTLDEYADMPPLVSDDDMPPLVSDTIDEPSNESDEPSDELPNESSGEYPPNELMFAVFRQPSCPCCAAALKVLLTHDRGNESTESDTSESEHTSESDDSEPEEKNVPPIILHTFLILITLYFLKLLMLLTETRRCT